MLRALLTLSLALTSGSGGAVRVELSNTVLPTDTAGRPLLTGETDALYASPRQPIHAPSESTLSAH